MEQVPGMLWLAALMGLLAACAFSFLFYIAFRRPRTEDVFEEERMQDAMSDDSARPEENATAELPTVPAADVVADTWSGGDTDIAADEYEASDTAAFDLPARDERDRDEEDAATMHAALAVISATAPDLSAAVEGEDDWFATGEGTPVFDDFDPQEDDLVVVWDDTSGAEPSIQVRLSEDDATVTHVLMGDVIVAQVRTKADLVHDHVSLMPLSLARTLGWAHA